MKKVFCVLFCICIFLAGCGDKSAVDKNCEIDESLLKKNFEFYSTEYKSSMTLTEYLLFLQDEYQSEKVVYIYEYVFFDLDSDGNNELVCRLAVGEDKYFGIVVFHEIENKIYSYDFTWRQFGDLKSDGAVSYSSSGFDYGFRTLAFDKEGYSSKTATYSEAIISEDGEITGMNYYVNNNKITKEEFDKSYEAYNQKAYIVFEEIRLDKYTFE